MKALYDDAGLKVVLSVSECLESNAKKIIPGIGINCQSSKRRLGMKFMSLFGFPIEASIDTITIGRKR